MHFPYNSPLVPITSLGPLRALQTLTTTERKKAKISNEDDFFTHHKRRFFFDFGPFVLFSTMLVCLSFPPQQEEKKKFCRERETWQLKRERFSFLVETSRTQKSRIITHHNRSSFFSVIQRHFSATLFVSEIKRRRNNVVSFCSFFSRRGFTRVSSSIVNTISIFIQRTTSGERFFL